MEQTEIDKHWAAEGESRVAAYEAVLLESIPISQVFEAMEKEMTAGLGDIMKNDRGT